MREKLLYAFLLSLTLALTSCEKEIPLDYRQVEPLYVAEAEMSQQGTKVVVSTTQDVTDNSRNSHYIDNATVVISSKKDDYSETLKLNRNGIYTSTWKAKPGYTYDIDKWQAFHVFVHHAGCPYYEVFPLCMEEGAV